MKITVLIVLGGLVVTIVDKVIGVDLCATYGFVPACIHDAVMMLWAAIIARSLYKK